MRPELSQAAELLSQNTPESIDKAIGLLQDTVFSFSMKMCGHREDAEDTMQDVLIGSLKHLSKLQGPGELAAWLYTVTRNRCRHMRRVRPETSAQRFSLDELLPDDAELHRLVKESSKSPEAEVLRTEQSSLLHESVLKLPASLRLVLVLHDMEELSAEEIAGILNLQVGTVRVRLHRARLTLRQEMARVLRGLPAQPQTKKKSVAKRPNECRKLFASLSEYIDARIDPNICKQMRAHIESCPECIAFLKDLRTVIDRCRSFPTACSPAVAQRLRYMLAKEYLRLTGKQEHSAT